MTIYKIGKLDVPRYKYDVIVLAQCLHESSTGNSDPLCPNDGLFMYEFLKARLSDWHDSYKITYKYDLAVKSLIEAAIEDYVRGHNKQFDEEWMKSNCKELDWIPYNPSSTA